MISCYDVFVILKVSTTWSMHWRVWQLILMTVLDNIVESVSSKNCDPIYSPSHPWSTKGKNTTYKN